MIEQIPTGLNILLVKVLSMFDFLNNKIRAILSIRPIRLKPRGPTGTMDPVNFF